MVRHKTRWLLVKVELPDYDDHQQTSMKASSLSSSLAPRIQFPSKKDLNKIVRQNISSSFGLAAECVAFDTQVRFVDPEARIVLLRVPRKDCGMVRAAMSLMTNLEGEPSNTSETKGKRQQLCKRSRRPNIVASVISVNGSARTAKLATMSYVRKVYRERIRSIQLLSSAAQERRKNLKVECDQLEKTLDLIQNID